METVITIIIWAAIIQGLLLGIIFIASQKHRSFANLLLGCFLIAFVFEAFTDLLPFDNLGNYSINGYFTLPEVKWFFPVLFTHFVLEKVGRSSRYYWFLRIHYYLAFGMLGITIINLALFLIRGQALLYFFGWEVLDYFYMSLQYYAFLLTIVGFIIAIRETLRYRNLARNEFTDLDMLDINWLWQIIFVIAPIILFWGAELFRIAMGGRGQSELTILAFVCIAVLNYFVSYKAFIHQNLFDGSKEAMRTIDKKPTIEVKLSTPIDHEICNKIKLEMEKNQYFLNQNLTIHDFAKEIRISARTISTCINQSTGNNFNEWVNNYRVERVLEIFKGKKNHHLSIEGIGYDAGFKSRSAMYIAFKKKTGQSPGNFREN